MKDYAIIFETNSEIRGYKKVEYVTAKSPQDAVNKFSVSHKSAIINCVAEVKGGWAQ